MWKMHLQLQPTPRSLLPSMLRWPKCGPRSGPGRCLKSSGPSWRGLQQPVRSKRKLWRQWWRMSSAKAPWWPCTPKLDTETITSQVTKQSTERKIRKLIPRGRESMMKNENNQWLERGVLGWGLTEQSNLCTLSKMSLHHHGSPGNVLFRTQIYGLLKLKCHVYLGCTFSFHACLGVHGTNTISLYNIIA